MFRSLRALLGAVASDVFDLLFPRACLVCGRQLPGRSNTLACAPCWACVATLPHPRCTRCGHPLGGGACHWCDNVHPAVVAVRSWCWADDRVGAALVHALKYHDWPSAASEIAERMARLDFGPGRDVRNRVVVPVPLAASRLRERGYNQSACLAAGLAARWGVASHDTLIARIRETPTQTRLTAEQRLHNVAGAFRVDARRVSCLGSAELFLVDDVVTTGATLNACAEALAGAGARSISYITFGRARDPRDARPSRGTTSHGDSRRR